MKKITAILTLLLVQNSYALQLEGMNGVEILAINGEEVSSGFFSSKKGNDVEPGEHQIVVRYSEQFNNDQSVESRPHIFTIDVQSDTQIAVTGIHSAQQAQRAVRKGISWQISDGDSSYQVNDSDTLKGEGFMPYSDIAGLVAKYNQDNNIVTTANVAVPVVTTTTAATAVQTTASLDLISSYQQASQAEKKAFRLWLLEQDLK